MRIQVTRGPRDAKKAEKGGKSWGDRVICLSVPRPMLECGMSLCTEESSQALFSKSSLPRTPMTVALKFQMGGIKRFACEMIAGNSTACSGNDVDTRLQGPPSPPCSHVLEKSHIQQALSPK